MKLSLYFHGRYENDTEDKENLMCAEEGDAVRCLPSHAVGIGWTFEADDEADGNDDEPQVIEVIETILRDGKVLDIDTVRYESDEIGSLVWRLDTAEGPFDGHYTFKVSVKDRPDIATIEKTVRVAEPVEAIGNPRISCVGSFAMDDGHFGYRPLQGGRDIDLRLVNIRCFGLYLELDGGSLHEDAVLSFEETWTLPDGTVRHDLNFIDEGSVVSCDVELLDPNVDFLGVVVPPDTDTETYTHMDTDTDTDTDGGHDQHVHGPDCHHDDEDDDDGPAEGRYTLHLRFPRQDKIPDIEEEFFVFRDPLLPPASPQCLQAFEGETGTTLCDDYRAFLERENGRRELSSPPEGGVQLNPGVDIDGDDDLFAFDALYGVDNGTWALDLARIVEEEDIGYDLRLLRWFYPIAKDDAGNTLVQIAAGPLRGQLASIAADAAEDFRELMAAEGGVWEDLRLPWQSFADATAEEFVAVAIAALLLTPFTHTLEAWLAESPRRAHARQS